MRPNVFSLACSMDQGFAWPDFGLWKKRLGGDLSVKCLAKIEGLCINIFVELRTPAMPFGLGAFVAAKLRSLCWQHRFEPGWYSREAEGPEQQR